MINRLANIDVWAVMLNTPEQTPKFICSILSKCDKMHVVLAFCFKLKDLSWATQIKEDRGINLDDLWKLLVMTFMNILWKIGNVIINFYIGKWGRNIKQTALNIEHGPHVKRIVSRIMGELTRWSEQIRKRDDRRFVLDFSASLYGRKGQACAPANHRGGCTLSGCSKGTQWFLKKLRAISIYLFIDRLCPQQVCQTC